MNGSSRATRAAIASSRATRPPPMSAASSSSASQVRKASASTRRRLAESSRLRSSHCSEAVSGPLRLSVSSRRARPHMRSLRTGLRL